MVFTGIKVNEVSYILIWIFVPEQNSSADEYQLSEDGERTSRDSAGSALHRKNWAPTLNPV